MPLTFVLPPSLGPAKAAARAELIQSALSRELGEEAIAIVAETYAELEDYLVNARAEMVWAPAAVCAKLASARGIFTIVRRGEASYRSAIVARKEDRLSLSTLAGKRAAWVDPLSAGGYLLAVSLLRAQGVDPDRTFSSQEFVGSHRAAVEAVLHETADVAAVSANAADDASLAATLHWYVGPTGDRLTSLGVSESCPNDAVVLTTRLGAAGATRVTAALQPATPGARARSRLLSALEAERLQPAEVHDYKRLRTLLWSEPAVHRSVAPPPITPSERPRSR